MATVERGVFLERRTEDEMFQHAARHAPWSEDWWTLYGSATVQVYPPANQLFQQGSAASDVYILDKGLVKLIRLNRAGEELIVGLRFPGALLGIAPVILCQPYPVTATTLTGCHMRRVHAELFLDLARSDSEFAWHLQQVHCREAYDQITQLVGLACLSATHRLEQFLRQLIAAQHQADSNGEIRIHLPLKHWEVAQLIAITPQHLSLVLRQMESEGTIRREKGWVIVRNCQRLYQPSDS